jgi:GxxExxY protein
MNQEIESVATHIVDSAVKIHMALGPGLLESAYQQCMVYELKKRGLKTESEVPIPIRYKSITIDAGYRADIRVENCIIVENKTVDRFLPIHTAQLLTYLKLSKCPLGFLLNWNVRNMTDGIRRMILTHD